VPCISASEKVGAPMGATMNSWTSTAVSGVGAAVEDVHHRHRQHVRVGAADVAEQRQVRRVGGGTGHRHRHAEDRVGAEPGLVGGAVEVEHRLVDEPLLVGVEAQQLGPISSMIPVTAFCTPLPP
jgi:hypothetical protein